MVTVRDADPVIGLVAALVGEDHRRDPGRVGLEGKDEHIEDQADVILIVLRHAVGLDGIVGTLDLLNSLLLGDGQAALDLTDRAEVLVNLAAVVHAEAMVE